MPEFSVSIVNDFEADSLQAAVEQFVDWIRSRDIKHFAFKVTDDLGRVYLVDSAYCGAVYQVGGPPDGEQTYLRDVSRFQDANFYDESSEVGPGVFVRGEALIVMDDGSEVRTSDEFRERFPDGVIPEDGDGCQWINNRWFEDADGNVMFHISEIESSE